MKDFLLFVLDLVDFSDEEGYGKYLDLHESYDKYTNIKGIEVQFHIDTFILSKLSYKHICSSAM